MCPDHETLERLALGLLSEEELAPLEEHLQTCQHCLQTLLESSPSDTVIEALGHGEEVLEGRAEIEEGVQRVKASVLAQLRDPYRTRPETGRQSKVQGPKSEVNAGGDTTGTGPSTFPPAPSSRTAPDGDEMDYSFLAPAHASDELGRLGAYNPDGTLLATYGEDGAVRLWNSETGELARIFVGADSPSGGIAWSPDGASIAVAAGTKIRAWHAASGKNVCTISLIDGEAASLAWSPDGKTFAVGQRPLDQPEAAARQLCLYDIATGARTAVRHREDWNIEQIAWSPDGKRLLTAGERSHSWLVDREELAVHQVQIANLHGGGRALAWTADGAPLVAGFSFGKLVPQLWRADRPELLREFATEIEGERAGWLALSGDGRLTVLGCRDTYQGYPSERAAYICEAQTGKVLAHFDHSPGHAGAWTEDAPIWLWEYEPRYAISRDGKRLARCGKRAGPMFFDGTTGAPLGPRQGTTMLANRELNKFLASWSSDAGSLAWRGEDGAVHFWPRATTSGQIGAPTPIWCSPYLHPMVATDFRWSRDDRALLAAFDCLTRIDQYSPMTGELESRRDREGAEGAGGLTLSPDGKFFAGNQDWHVRVFDAENSKLLKTLNGVTGEPVAWSPNARQVAVRHEEATEIWDVEANECVRRFDGGRASLVWSPDGSRFVLSGGGEATIHNAASGNVLHELDDPPLGPAEVWPRLSWSPDSRRIAGRGRIWDAETGEAIARLPRVALAGETGAPAWSPDGSTLAYLGPGRSVVVANVAPKVCDSTAQGETLGNDTVQNAIALKGRDSDRPRVIATGAAGESRPVGANGSDGAPTQGSAALHPGLWNTTPSGSPRVAAMLLTFNRGQVLSIAPSGHFRASPRADELLAYVVETADGQETLSRDQFAERFDWKNDAARATPGSVGNALGGVPRITNDPASTGDNVEPRNATEGVPYRDERRAPMGDTALVHRSAALPGVESWTIAPRRPPHVQNQWQPIDLSSDGKWLAHAGQNGAVRLIDTASGKVERLFVGHDDPLTAVAFSPDGKLLASLDSVGGNVRIWEATMGRLIHSVYGGAGRLYGTVHWSPDSAILAVCAEYAPFRLLDVASGEFLPQPIGHDGLLGPGCFAWSPDASRFLSMGRGNQLQVWDTSTLGPVLALDGKCDPVTHAFGWSPDGAMIADHAGRGLMRIWDAATGHLLRTLSDEHPVWDVRLAWLPDSKTIVINGGQGAAGWRLWDAIAGKPASDVVPYGNIWGFSLGHNGETLAMGDYRIGLFDVPSRSLRREVEAIQFVHSAAWSPDGRELAVTGPNMTVWSNNKHHGLAMLPTPRFLASWAADPNAILISHWDNYADLYRRRGERWEPQFSKSIEIGDGSCPTMPSPDGKRLAYAGKQDAAAQNKESVEILDLATAKRLVQTKPLGQYIRALAWSPEGALLAAGTNTTGTEGGRLAIYNSATGRQLAELPPEKAQTSPIAFSPDGKTLAVGCGGDGNGFARLYDVEGLKAEGKRQKAEEDDGKTVSDTTPPHPSSLPEGEGVKAEGERQKAESEEPKT